MPQDGRIAFAVDHATDRLIEKARRPASRPAHTAYLVEQFFDRHKTLESQSEALRPVAKRLLSQKNKQSPAKILLKESMRRQVKALALDMLQKSEATVLGWIVAYEAQQRG